MPLTYHWYRFDSGPLRVTDKEATTITLTLNKREAAILIGGIEEMLEIAMIKVLQGKDVKIGIFVVATASDMLRRMNSLMERAGWDHGTGQTRTGETPEESLPDPHNRQD